MAWRSAARDRGWRAYGFDLREQQLPLGHYLEIQYIPRVRRAFTVFLRLARRGIARFLWYNAHPAEIFMGDVGSLSLGGTLGTIAVIISRNPALFSSAVSSFIGKRFP